MAFKLVLGLFSLRLGFLICKMDAKISPCWELLSEIKCQAPSLDHQVWPLGWQH